jgi:hypothetical protein
MKKLLPSLLLTAAIVLAAGNQPARADAPGSHLLLLSGANARQEIGLSASQQTSLDRLIGQYRQEIAPLMGRRDAQSAAMIEASTRAFDNRARAVLTPEQQSRLLQVEAKTLGPWVLHSPSVQEQLVLTDGQIARINAIAEKTQARNSELHRQVDAGKITPQERINKMRVFRLGQHRSLERILTPEQLATLRSLADS